jgi:hypothetical protein
MPEAQGGGETCARRVLLWPYGTLYVRLQSHLNRWSILKNQGQQENSIALIVYVQYFRVWFQTSTY